MSINEITEESVVDRRQAVRVPTRRQAHFSDLTSASLLRDGTVVNISRTGILLHTHAPVPQGSLIHMELEALTEKGPSQPLLLRGRVCHVTPLENGVYGVGVQLRVGPVSTKRIPPSPYATRQQARQDLNTALESLRKLPADSAALLTLGPNALAPGQAVRFKAADQSSRRKLGRWLFLAALVMALLLLLVWVLDAGLLPPRGGSKTSSRSSSPAQAERKPSPSSPITKASSSRRDSDAVQSALLRPALVPTAAAAPGEAAGIVGIPMGGPGDETALETTSPELEALEPLPPGFAPQLAAMTDRLMGQAVDGQAPLVLAGLVLPGEALDGSPARGESEKASRLEVSDVLVLEPVTHEAANAPLFVDVDKTGRVLTLVRGGQAARQFPVGVGAGDSTPEGQFRIVNKIKNPAWYNRGQSVKANDPANPLGAHWMGLGKENVGTSYGIHETTEPGAVSEQQSRGCVRMYPGDMAALFRNCPVGTLVSIHR